MAGGLGAGLVEVLERCPAKFELAGRLEADVAVLTLERDDLAVLEDRLPAIFGEAEEEVVNSAALIPRRRPVIGAAIDELLVLGTDAPTVARFFAPGENRQEVVAALYRRAGGIVGSRCNLKRALAAGNPQRQSPTADIHAASPARAAVSALRMRGPREMAMLLGAARIASRSPLVKPPSGPVRMTAGPGVKACPAGSPPPSSAK